MSDEIKHTRGPLTIKGPSMGILPNDDGGDYGIYDSVGKVIGEAIGLVGYGDPRPAEANARLWAASGDLFVLVLAVEWMKVPNYSFHLRCPWCKARKEDGHADHCARQVAIAKVTGDNA